MSPRPRPPEAPAAAPTSAASTPVATAVAARGDERGASSWAVAGLGIVALALAAWLIVQLVLLATPGSPSRASREQATKAAQSSLDKTRVSAVLAAANEVATLLTVSSQTSQQDLKTLLAGATADFRDQLTQESKTFTQALSQGKVSATGQVASAGLVSMNSRRSAAVVAIAASATVKNTSSPKGDVRNYRIKVQLSKVHDKWLVAGLAFVV